MREFTHKPVQVKGLQVARPYVNVTRGFPFSRPITSGGGDLSYYLVTDKPGGTVQRAYPGDWIVKYEDKVLVLTDEQHQRNYEEIP